MKKLILCLTLLMVTVSFGDWEVGEPADSTAWNVAAGFIRDNWVALEAVIGVGLEPNLVTIDYNDVRTRDPETNVEWYGAIPNDGVDDTDEIQAAIDYASAGTTQTGQTPTQGGTVYMSSGTYIISSTGLTVNSAVTLRGEGKQATILNCSAVTANNFCIRSVDQAFYVGMHEFAINGASGTTCKGGIYLGNASTETGNESYYHLSDILVYGINTATAFGIQAGNISHAQFDSVQVQSLAGAGAIGCVLNVNTHVGGGMVFNACKFGSSAGVTDQALRIVSSDVAVAIADIGFYNCFFGGGVNCVELALSDGLSTAMRDIGFYGCNWESDTTGAMLKVKEVRGLTVINNSFHGGGVSPQAIHFDGTGEVDGAWLKNNIFVDILTDAVKITAPTTGSYGRVEVDGIEYSGVSYLYDVNDASGYATIGYDEAVTAFTVDDATPSVLFKTNFTTNDDNALSITDFHDPHKGQIINIMGNDSGATTIAHDATKINLEHGKNFVLEDNDMLVLQYDGTDWNEMARSRNASPIGTMANDATPSIAGGDIWLTGGTTTITDFDDGFTGQILIVIAEHALTITDGTNILLDGSANWTMAATDTLTLIQKADGKWYELSHSDNG